MKSAKNKFTHITMILDSDDSLESFEEFEKACKNIKSKPAKQILDAVCEVKLLQEDLSLCTEDPYLKISEIRKSPLNHISEKKLIKALKLLGFEDDIRAHAIKPLLSKISIELCV
ncbi:MAG: hypothetical protein WCK52_03570 [Betaproteobacteria bacterium]|jgi:hypothetical protein